jgi:hypothetical protein
MELQVSKRQSDGFSFSREWWWVCGEVDANAMEIIVLSLRVEECEAEKVKGK